MYPQSGYKQVAAKKSPIVDPLIAVEDNLGGVESWPTCIIYDIFVVNPNTISVQNVAAFMYGNVFPVEKAVDCFIECIGLDSYYVTCAMKDS